MTSRRAILAFVSGFFAAGRLAVGVVAIRRREEAAASIAMTSATVSAIPALAMLKIVLWMPPVAATAASVAANAMAKSATSCFLVAVGRRRGVATGAGAGARAGSTGGAVGVVGGRCA